MQKPSKHFKIQAISSSVLAIPDTLRSVFLVDFPRILNFYLLRVFQIIFLALISLSVSAETFFTTEHIFTLSNPTAEAFEDPSLLKIGPNHALFISQASKSPRREFFSDDITIEIYLLDVRTKSVTKKADLRAPSLVVTTTKVSSREVWVDVSGHLFLADSVTGEITFIRDFGVSFAGSLGPWGSCLSVSGGIFVVNNFSYFRIGGTDQCQAQVNESEAMLYVFDHKTKRLSPIQTNQTNSHINTSYSFLIIDNPTKGDDSAVAIVSDLRRSEQDTSPVQFWEIEPTTRSLTLLNETQDHFIYSRRRGFAKTTKGVYICDDFPRRVVRVSNSLTVDTVPGSADTGCDDITEYRDHIFWRPSPPSDQSKIWYSDGTLIPSKSINGLGSSRFVTFSCQIGGKLFYIRYFGFSHPSSMGFINEEFNSTSIDLEDVLHVETCLDNQILTTKHPNTRTPERSLYNILTTKNSPIRRNNPTRSHFSDVVQLDNRLFGLTQNFELNRPGIEITIDVSIDELVEREFDLAPIHYLLLSDD